jgi:hypothetical protein
MKMSDEIKTTTQKEMNLLKMNDRQFAEYLTESMTKEGTNTLSHATVINWRKHGKPPSTDFLQDMLSVYPVSDRRFRFALRMLSLKSPHIWGFEGVVWRLKPSKLLAHAE